MAVTKAAIDIEDGEKIGMVKAIECMFNPREFTITKGADWRSDDTVGTALGTPRFVSVTQGSFTLDLTFDTTSSGIAVTKHTDLLLRLVEPNSHLKDDKGEKERPPCVWFRWGQWKSFKSVVSSVSVTFTYFASDGTPLRATASVSFQQVEAENTWPRQNPTSHTPVPHRVHQLQRGETLDRVAYRYFNDATGWRDIARANQITDPLAVPVGALLIIPRRERLT